MHERRPIYMMRDILKRLEPEEKDSKFLAELQKVIEEMRKDFAQAIRHVTTDVSRRK